MTTGIIAAVLNGTVTYTAPTDAKLVITVAGSGGYVTINNIYALNGASTISSLTHYLGTGQTVTITALLGTYMIASVLEAN